MLPSGPLLARLRRYGMWCGYVYQAPLTMLLAGR